MSKFSKLRSERSHLRISISGDSKKPGNGNSIIELQGKRILVRALSYPPYPYRRRHYGESWRSSPSSIFSRLLGFDRNRRPWWLWSLGFIDTLLGLILAFSISFAALPENVSLCNDDRDISIIILLAFSSLIQISMGTGLIRGLCSQNDLTTASCLQGWLYGAYFLLIKTCYFLAVDIIKKSTADGEVRNELGTVVGNIIGILRVIAVISVQRYLDDFRASSGAITRRNLHEKLNRILMERFQDPRSKELNREIQSNGFDRF